MRGTVNKPAVMKNIIDLEIVCNLFEVEIFCRTVYPENEASPDGVAVINMASLQDYSSSNWLQLHGLYVMMTTNSMR